MSTKLKSFALFVLIIGGAYVMGSFMINMGKDMSHTIYKTLYKK
ncbi:hypothetical protein MNB_SUP05-SYMBIONT-4-4 [hydrothermal vent metagenome]|uniref:Uncharacterized protein n=1 Tax=hydrothermal vent metagenome TaxID=652676 RepID=A0A1W1E625_9ZZZZ